MRATVSLAKSQRLAKATNEKIPVTAGAITGALAGRPFFALAFFLRSRTCRAVLES